MIVRRGKKITQARGGLSGDADGNGGMGQPVHAAHIASMCVRCRCHGMHGEHVARQRGGHSQVRRGFCCIKADQFTIATCVGTARVKEEAPKLQCV
jgi:hypothetical protein